MIYENPRLLAKELLNLIDGFIEEDNKNPSDYYKGIIGGLHLALAKVCTPKEVEDAKNGVME